VGTPAERGDHDALVEVDPELDHRLVGEAVGKDEELGLGVDLQTLVEGDHFLSEVDRLAGVVALTHPGRGELREVFQTEVVAIGVRKGHGELASVELLPHLPQLLLGLETVVCLVHLPEQCLECHGQLMRHGADERQVELEP